MPLTLSHRVRRLAAIRDVRVRNPPQGGDLGCIVPIVSSRTDYEFRKSRHGPIDVALEGGRRRPPAQQAGPPATPHGLACSQLVPRDWLMIRYTDLLIARDEARGVLGSSRAVARPATVLAHSLNGRRKRPCQGPSPGRCATTPENSIAVSDC